MSFLEPRTHIGNPLTAEADSEPSETRKIELFAKNPFSW